MPLHVIDWEKTERGPQRRKTKDGRLLHCCCICGRIEPWNAAWTTYCSMKELDEVAPIPKFCGIDCQDRGGPDAVNVSDEMKRKAKDTEWREPEVVYREATSHEKYNAAAAAQRPGR